MSDLFKMELNKNWAEQSVINKLVNLFINLPIF